MSAAIHCWPPPPLAASAARRPLSRSSLTPQRSPLLRLTGTNNITSLPHLPPRITESSRRSNSRGLAYEAPSSKYIREDYLVRKVTAKEVEELVRGERSLPVVLDFYSTWCGPCILMAQELEMLAVEYEGNVMFLKVDTDEEYEFARDMQVRGLPTLYFISPDPNKDAIRTEGLVPPEMIKNIIDNEL